jgi:hypothetical protein
MKLRRFFLKKLYFELSQFIIKYDFDLSLQLIQTTNKKVSESMKHFVDCVLCV